MAVALLDLDGTLIDSGPVIFAAARHALQAVGLPEPEDMRPFIGPPLTDGVRDVLGVPAALVDDVIELYRVHQLAHLAHTPIYAGIPEALAELRSEGWALAVATSKREDMALRTMEVLGMSGMVDVIAGGDQASCAKEVVISRAIARLTARGALPAPPIMVGDRMHDIAGARSHGLRSVFASWGYGALEEAAHADAIAHTPTGLFDTLTSLA